MLRVFVVLIGCLIAGQAWSQNNCNNTESLFHMAAALNTYQSDDYQLKNQLTVSLSGDDTYTIPVTLNTGSAYAFILSAPAGVRATGIEIQDMTGFQVQYEYKILEADNYILSSDFIAENGGSYKILFKVVPQAGTVCAAISLLENDHPDEAKAVKKEK